MNLHFIKMNGAGNDFVIFDARKQLVKLTADKIRELASRENAVTKGCDQLIIMEPSQKADVFMRIYNADGGEVDACGNATRCIGWLLIEEKGDMRYQASVETNAGVLKCQRNIDIYTQYPGSDAVIEANMGQPTFEPSEIPVSGQFNLTMLSQIAGTLGIENVVDATCVGIGNPHVIFFVSHRPTTEQLEKAGEQIKAVPLFMPHGVNLTIAEVGEKAIFASVYERGAGITKSCGTAACATAVAAIQLGYRKKNVDILVQQLQRKAEDLFARWGNKDVYLIGPVKKEFERFIDV